MIIMEWKQLNIMLILVFWEIILVVLKIVFIMPLDQTVCII